MKALKKISVLALVFALLFSFAACSGSSGETTTQPETLPPVTSAPIYVSKVAALYGPYGMASTLIAQDRSYAFDVEYYSSSADVTAALKNGSAELATLPLKEAVKLYNETDGAIKILFVSNTNFLYVLQKGDSVDSLSDLDGKKIYAAGEGTGNDKIISHIFAESGVDPDIEYCASYDEAMTKEDADLIILPETYASKLMFENPEYSIAVDFGAEWENLMGVKLAQACFVATEEYINAHSEELSNFLTYYEVAVNFMNDIENRQHAISEPLVLQGFFSDPDLALSAVPNCGIVFITGDDMKATVYKNIEQLLILDSDLAGLTAPGDGIFYAG